MIDVESLGGLPVHEFCDSLLKLDLVEEAYRQKPLVYTYRNFYNKYLQGKLDDYKLMIAMYTDEEPVLADEHDIIALRVYRKRKTDRCQRLCGQEPADGSA